MARPLPLAHDVLAATAIAEEHQLSFRHAMIVRSASELGCETLWTEDLTSGQQIGDVTVRTPFT